MLLNCGVGKDSFFLEKALESRLDCKEIQPAHPKDQSWVSIGRTDFEAGTLATWSKKLTHFPFDTGKDWGQEEKGMTEDEILGCITDLMDMGLGGLWELVIDREA